MLIAGGKAEAALEVEGVGERGPLHEGGEARAGQLLQRLEVVVLAHGDAAAPPRIVAERGVGDFGIALGEVELELIVEATVKRSIPPEPCASQPVRKSHPPTPPTVGPHATPPT